MATTKIFLSGGRTIELDTYIQGDLEEDYELPIGDEWHAPINQLEDLETIYPDATAPGVKPNEIGYTIWFTERTGVEKPEEEPYRGIILRYVGIDNLEYPEFLKWEAVGVFVDFITTPEFDLAELEERVLALEKSQLAQNVLLDGILDSGIVAGNPPRRVWGANQLVDDFGELFLPNAWWYRGEVVTDSERLGGQPPSYYLTSSSGDSRYVRTTGVVAQSYNGVKTSTTNKGISSSVSDTGTWGTSSGARFCGIANSGYTGGPSSNHRELIGTGAGDGSSGGGFFAGPHKASGAHVGKSFSGSSANDESYIFNMVPVSAFSKVDDSGPVGHTRMAFGGLGLQMDELAASNISSNGHNIVQSHVYNNPGKGESQYNHPTQTYDISHTLNTGLLTEYLVYLISGKKIYTGREIPQVIQTMRTSIHNMPALEILVEELKNRIAVLEGE